MQTTTLKKTLLHNKSIEHLCRDWGWTVLKKEGIFRTVSFEQTFAPLQLLTTFLYHQKMVLRGASFYNRYVICVIIYSSCLFSPSGHFTPHQNNTSHKMYIFIIQRSSAMLRNNLASPKNYQETNVVTTIGWLPSNSWLSDVTLVLSAVLKDFIIHINWVYLVNNMRHLWFAWITWVQVDQASVWCTSLDQVELSNVMNRSDCYEVNEIIRSFYDLHHASLEDIYFCLHCHHLCISDQC